MVSVPILEDTSADRSSIQVLFRASGAFYVSKVVNTIVGTQMNKQGGLNVGWKDVGVEQAWKTAKSSGNWVDVESDID